MYKYKIYNRLSTALSKIIDTNTNDVIGYIKKDYANIITRFVDLIGDGKFFNGFKVYDNKKNLLFKSKQISPFKYKQFVISFFNDNEKKLTFEISDKSWFKSSEKVDFKFLEETYELHKNIEEWSYIINKKTDKKIAKWKNPITSPTSIYFELLDDNLKEYDLQLLGLFHTYLYSD